ncbi:hypothetical protein EDE15_1130 [Edaphobacter aggregans]|uniref:Uncharacterized protein n=1 Tax=Edaphobacter aggregans TaxID=570835 RepID=A0A428MFG4_9BACT|nr:hypothetical protein EDE15_1130 [Edaphobacter aggregans]
MSLPNREVSIGHPISNQEPRIELDLSVEEMEALKHLRSRTGKLSNKVEHMRIIFPV